MEIKNEKEHQSALLRIEELMDLDVVKELDELSRSVSDYEDKTIEL